MSGHSKWNNIRIRKGIQDRKRSEIFTKASRDILTALRLGKGVDTAIQRAKEVNMPKENITRLINRFNERKGNLIDFTLEGFGPFNIPLMIAVATDNRNRALAEIKTLFKDNGGHLSENGGVAFLFDRLGEIEVAQLSEEKELELIDQGAVDFDDNKVYCQPADLNRLEEILGIKGEIVMRPKTVFNVDGKLAPKILDFIDKLENHDD
ncbi:MAG TPA: YebC/PmpR family DNA-binding transcriptional regulator, partial [Candidatus Woesebacteria bacterium]|nr:YebC/PmpR family DNA-binding transcriptional regulator [Candidatus Woesebacteria bacterium]